MITCSERMNRVKFFTGRMLAAMAMTAGAVRVLMCLTLATGFTLPLAAQNYVWSGAGGDDSWGTDANWEGDTAPAASFMGQASFSTNDAGGINTVEQNRTITGTLGSLTEGLFYNIGGGGTNLDHTTDLDGNTLVLNGGSLQVGYDTTNSSAIIQNGTLRLGETAATDIYVGVAKGATVWRTNNHLRVTGAIDAANLRNVRVGYNGYGNGPGAHGRIDWSGATIRSGSDINTLRLSGDLDVCIGGGALVPRNYRGELLLPASLESLDVRDLRVGYDRSSLGTLDFGTGSALTNLAVRGDFRLSDASGRGEIVNLPENLDITVGTTGGASSMNIAWYHYSAYDVNTTTATLAPVGGHFVGRLAELYVGFNYSGNTGDQTGLLDLSQTLVQIGDEVNKVKVNTLSIGSRLYPNGAGNGYATGTVKLPSNITEIVTGNFHLGHGYHGKGYLDLPRDSMLQTLTASNTFSIGGGYGGFIGYDDGGGFKSWLPTGVTVNVGLPDSRAVMYVCRRAAHNSRADNGEGELTVSNGTFSAYLSSLIVGINTDDPAGTRTAVGILDLRNATVSAFDVEGDVAVGAQTGSSLYAGAGTGNKDGSGYLHLPACEAAIDGNLSVGDTHATSFGLLDLYGTAVSLSQACTVYATGIVTTRVYASSCGLDIASTSTNDFIIADGGRVHLVFTSDEPKLWGLRMAGDQSAHFQALHDGGRLTWSAPVGANPVIAYAGDATVVWIPPLAGTVILIQ